MIWTLIDVLIKIYSGILLCSVLGTILYLIWKGSSQFVEKKDCVEVSYWIWKIVLLSFCVPITFVYVINIDEGTKAWLFWHTKVIEGVVTAVAVIWSIGFLITFWRLMRQYRIISRDVKKSLKCSLRVQEKADQIRNMLGIRKQIPVVIQKKAGCPMLYGICKPMVILPREYEMEELEIIFRHEFMHYQHHDLVWKHMTNIVRCIHWFHPVMKDLFVQMDQWSEVFCDIAVSKSLNDVKYYFSVIIDISTDMPIYGKYTTSGLYEDVKSLKLRMKRVQSYRKKKIYKKWVSVLLLAGVVLISGVTVSASGFGFIRGYNWVVDHTEAQSHDITTEDNPLIVRKIKIRKHRNKNINKITERKEKLEDGKAVAVVWDVASKERVETKSSYLKKDTEIEISVSTGLDEKQAETRVSVGIISEDGTEEYVEKGLDIFQKFKIKKEGYYKIFMENWGEKQGSFGGYYYID